MGVIMRKTMRRLTMKIILRKRRRNKRQVLQILKRKARIRSQ